MFGRNAKTVIPMREQKKRLKNIKKSICLILVAKYWGGSNLAKHGPALAQHHAHHAIHEGARSGAIQKTDELVTLLKQGEIEAAKMAADRSEERRVGKECRSRWEPYDEKRKRERTES